VEPAGRGSRTRFRQARLRRGRGDDRRSPAAFGHTGSADLSVASIGRPTASAAFGVRSKNGAQGGERRMGGGTHAEQRWTNTLERRFSAGVEPETHSIDATDSLLISMCIEARAFGIRTFFRCLGEGGQISALATAVAGGRRTRDHALADLDGPASPYNASSTGDASIPMSTIDSRVFSLERVHAVGGCVGCSPAG
jgi:hypothetical protein